MIESATGAGTGKEKVRLYGTGAALSASIVWALAGLFWLAVATSSEPAWATVSVSAVMQADEEKKSGEEKEKDKKKEGDEEEDEAGDDDEQKDTKDADEGGEDEESGDSDEGEKKESTEEKDQAEQKEDGEKGDKDAASKKDGDKKSETKDGKSEKKDSGKAKPPEPEGMDMEAFDKLEMSNPMLSEEQLSEMKKILMERMRETREARKTAPKKGKQGSAKAPPTEPPVAKPHAGKRPAQGASVKPPAGKAAPARRGGVSAKPPAPSAKGPSRRGTAGKASPRAGAKKPDEQRSIPSESPKSQSEGTPKEKDEKADTPKPKERRSMKVKPRSKTAPGAPQAMTRRTTASGKKRSPAATRGTRGTRGVRAPDDALTGDRSGIIFPPDLPEGTRPWDLSEKHFFFSFDRVSPQDLLEDFSRLAGLSVMGMDKVKGQPITYESLEYMNYWEAFGTLNELFVPNGIQVLMEKQHLRVVSSGDLRQYIQPENTFRSREKFEEASPEDPILVKVFFVPPTNVAPTQVAQWINDLPESIRLGSTSPGNMHVSGFARDIRKLFFLVDIVNAQGDADGRQIRWYPVEKGDVNQIADLVRQFVGSGGRSGAPSIKPRRGKGVPTQIEPLEDFSEVEVLAVPAAKMLMVNAKLSKHKKVEEILAQLFQHVPEETLHDPVVIPLRHARAEDIIPLLESVMTGEPRRSVPGKPAVRKTLRRKGTSPQADTIDLGGAAKEVTILPEPNSNSLIVLADDEGVERVRKLLDIFDVPQIPPSFVRVSLEYARVESVQQVLGVLFPGASAKRPGKGAASSAQLTLVPDAGANTLFLAGKEAVIKRAREIIEQIDIPTAESVRHMVTLVNQSPSTLASLLEKIEGGGGGAKGRKGALSAEGLKFIPFNETNTLIVICPDTKWPELRELIESVDRDVEDFLVTRTFKIEKADVTKVASLLREWFGGGAPGRGKSKRKGASSTSATGLTIVVDEAGSQIFVRGDEETVSKMVDFVADIEAGWEETKGTRRTFRLTYISTSDAKKLLTTLYPRSAAKGRGKAGAEGARVATVGQNSIVVQAGPVQMEEIADLISELDTEEQDNTEIRSFPVEGADPQQLVRNLGSMFKATAVRGKSARKSGPIFIAAGKKVIAIAEAGEFARIERAIEVLREEPTGIVVKQFQVEYADVEDLARRLPGLLEPYVAEFMGGGLAGKGSKGGGKIVRVDADPRTGTLFVAAPGQVIPHAEELIEVLDQPMEVDTAEVIVRTVVLRRAEVSELIQSLQKMMQGGASTPAKKAASRTGPRSFHARMTGKMKGQVSMVPAPGANSVILRGIESDVDQVEELIRVIDDSARSTKKIAKRYDATDTGMYIEDLADLVTAVTGGGGKAKPKSEDEFLDPIGGPRISKDMIITTDYYTDTMVVVATPEKHEEIELLFDALTASVEGLTEPDPGKLTMVEVANADPEYVKEMVEDILDELIDRGPKTRLTLMPGSNRIALKGPPEQIETVVGWIRELDIAGVAPAPEFHIRSPGKTPVQIEQLLRMIQQRTPGLELVVQGVEIDDDGKSAAEKYGIEEINPTYGPATLTYISAELGRLSVGAAQDPSAEPERAEADAVQQEDEDENGEEEDKPALPSSIADMKPTHKAIIKITVDPATGALLIEGAPKDIRKFNKQLDEVLEDLEKLKIDKPDIRVFRVKYVNVTEAARIMETILGAQMGGAASRQQQAMQQLRQQQQNLQRQQRVRQQAQMRKMMQQMAGGGGKEAAQEAEEEEPSAERDEGPRQFGTSKIHVYPDSRTSTIIVRAATEDYPVILELLGKIDQKPAETEFKVFKLARLKAADVETAIKSILRMDRAAPRAGRARPGRPGQPAQPGQGPQAQLMALQQQIDAMQDTGGGDAVAINWAEQVTITSEASTNTILATGPKQAIVQIERMIEELEGQEIDKETVQTIQLQHASVDEILPALNEVFSAARAPGSGKTRPGAGKAGEAVLTAFSQVLIAGDSRTNTLIVKALDSDMADVEELIAVLDVETEAGRPELHPLSFADAPSVASALSAMFISGDKKKGNVRIVAETGTNSILITAPPILREQMVAQLEALDDRARRGSEPRTIPIVSGSAELIAEQLQPIFGGRNKPGSSVTIVGNNMARKLVVMAPDAVFAEIEKLVGVLDVPTSESTIHIYELEHAAAEETLAKMQDIITQMIRNKIATGAGKDVDLDAFAATADPRTNSLIVLGSPATHMMIGTVLAQLDVPEKGASQMDTMMFPLRIANANEVARQIQDLFKDRKGPGVAPPVATPNPSLNVLFVRGTQSQLEEVQGFIENLENITELGQGELQSYTIRLIYADPEQTAEMLDEHFRKKFDDMKQAGVKGVKPTDMRVSITPDPNTNQLFVTASAANKEVLDGLLATIDVEEAKGAATPNTRVFTPAHGDPNAIANAVNKIFQPIGKRGSPKDRVLAVPDPISGTVVVVANEENMERAAKLIGEMDTETSARQTFTYPVKEARAGELVEVLRDYITQSQRGRVGRGRTPVSLVADEPTNTILVDATPQEYEQLLPTIELLDQPPRAETGMMVRQIEVTHVEAREVAQALTHMFVQGRRPKQGETPIGVTNPVGTRTILVRSDERTFEQIQRVVSDMDRPEAGSNDMRVFTLTNLEPAETKTMLEDYFKKPGGRGNELLGGVRVTESDSLNAVVVSGPSEQLEQAAAFIKEVDLDPAERGDVPQIIRLEWADAGQMAETLNQMFGQSGGRGGRGQQAGKAPVIIPEVASNSLIVRARPREMNQIRSMVLVLDTEELKGSGGNVEIIQVAQGLNIDELASQIESVVNAGERARAKAVPGAKAAEIAIGTHQHTNSLLISGAPQLFAQVRTIVETLQRSGGPGPNKVVIRKAVHRSPAEIKQILDELITGNKSGSGRSSSRRATPPRRPTRGRR